MIELTKYSTFWEEDKSKDIVDKYYDEKGGYNEKSGNDKTSQDISGSSQAGVNISQNAVRLLME